MKIDLSRQGLSTRYAAVPATQHLGRRSVRAVLARQSRWMVIRRRQAVGAFAFEPLTGTPVSVVAALLAAPALGLAPWAAALLTVLWRLAAEMAALRMAGWPMASGYPFAALARDVLLAILWLPTWRTRRVDWVGRSHRVSVGGKDLSRAGHT